MLRRLGHTLTIRNVNKMADFDIFFLTIVNVYGGNKGYYYLGRAKRPEWV